MTIPLNQSCQLTVSVSRPTKTAGGYVVLSEIECRDLTHAVRQRGDEQVARDVGSSKYAIVRAALALPVQAGTAALVRGWLAASAR